MALGVRKTAIKEIDINNENDISTVLKINFAVGAGVFGKEYEPTTKNLTNILRVCESQTLKTLKNVSVRIMFHDKLFIAIGHYSKDIWCHFPSGGTLLTINEIKQCEAEFNINWNY